MGVEKALSQRKIEIKELFDKNEIDDLKRFMHRRQNLNKCNSYLVYIFHIMQSAGILTTSVATSRGYKELMWIGIGLNMIASIIQVFEKINDGQMKRLMNDIKAIKAGSYVDESPLVDIEKDMSGVGNVGSIGSSISSNDDKENIHATHSNV